LGKSKEKAPRIQKKTKKRPLDPNSRTGKTTTTALPVCHRRAGTGTNHLNKTNRHITFAKKRKGVSTTDGGTKGKSDPLLGDRLKKEVPVQAAETL